MNKRLFVTSSKSAAAASHHHFMVSSVASLIVITIATILVIAPFASPSLSSSSSMMMMMASATTTTTTKTMIQLTECFDNTCQNRCQKHDPFPNNFCHIERWGDRSQQAECAPAQPPNARCIQETIYQYGFLLKNSDHYNADAIWKMKNQKRKQKKNNNIKNQNNNNQNDNENAIPQPPQPTATCDPDRAYSTEPRQCNTCLKNRVHRPPPGDGGVGHNDDEFEFVMFTNCENENEILLKSKCDSTCKTCLRNETVTVKQCIPKDEFGINVQYSAPVACAGQLIVSTFNRTVHNCTGGRPEQVSHTITKACYTERPGRSVIYECIQV